MQIITDRAVIFDFLRQGAILVTPNNRLSEQLLHSYGHYQQQKVLEKPRCFSYQSFLHYCYQQLQHLYPFEPHPQLLNHHQQRHLWRRILNQALHDECNEGHLSAIMDAWTRCQQWKINSDDPLFQQTPQTRQFQSVSLQFLRALSQLNAITETQVVDYLSQYPDSTDVQTIWACFDDFSPQQKTLIQQLTNRGHEPIYYELPAPHDNAHVFAAKDSQEEYRTLRHWVQTRLSEGDQQIAVVVPDLQAHSTRLQRFFQQTIPAADFNISLGKPLSAYPLIAHTLQFLELSTDTITHDAWNLLIHSPYLTGSKTEFLARSQLVQQPLFKEPVIDLTALIQLSTRTAPQLAALLEGITEYPTKASPHEWVTCFRNRLKHLGFPGDYPLQSASYQCFQRFLLLLDEYLELTVLYNTLDQKQAIAHLKDLAHYTVFQPRKPPCRVQILGLLEASGCTFDSIWVCGMSDHCLPSKIQLSPYIPLTLQREKNMPHALPERELQWAQQFIQRIQSASPCSIFSYARWVGDTPHLPSPLITHCPTYHPPSNRDNEPVCQLIPLTETYEYPLTTNEPIAGGTALLANQAKCPFRAFAAHRLHARSPYTKSHGLDNMERGQVLHRVMDAVWQQLKNQETLLALSAPALEKIVTECIHLAFQPFLASHAFSFPPLIQNVESKRLRRLVNAALDWERERPPFNVESLEQTFNITIGDVLFQVRVDRIDCLDHDKRWVIDYKSTLPGSKPWLDDRPEEPQLILYALLDHRINTLLFIQLKTGQLACSGFSEETIPVKGIQSIAKDETWEHHQTRWKTQLTQLAEEFQAGFCPPQPTKNTTCQHCDFKYLCRLDYT